MTLEHYLNTVTAPFPPDTARRIRGDLKEHALAHTESLQEAGHPDPEGAALAALGSATQVQHALMREHFTRAEEDELWHHRAYRRAEVRSLMRWALDMAGMLAVPFLGLVFSDRFGFHWGAYAVYAAVMLLLNVLDLWIPRRFSLRSTRVLLALLRASQGGAVILGLQGVWGADRTDLWINLVATLLGVTIGLSLALCPLWPYLPKALRGAR